MLMEIEQYGNENRFRLSFLTWMNDKNNFLEWCQNNLSNYEIKRIALNRIDLTVCDESDIIAVKLRWLNL